MKLRQKLIIFAFGKHSICSYFSQTYLWYFFNVYLLCRCLGRLCLLFLLIELLDGLDLLLQLHPSANRKVTFSKVAQLHFIEPKAKRDVGNLETILCCLKPATSIIPLPCLQQIDTALHCPALHWTALHCTVLHWSALLCTAWPGPQITNNVCVQLSSLPVHCKLYSIQYIMYSIQYKLYSVHCTLYRVQCIVPWLQQTQCGPLNPWKIVWLSSCRPAVEAGVVCNLPTCQASNLPSFPPSNLPTQIEERCQGRLKVVSHLNNWISLEAA